MRSKSIQSFITSQLELSEIDNVTVAELYDAYCNYCKGQGWIPVREQLFQETSRHLILRFFEAIRCNDIIRCKPNGKETPLRGYHGLSLITQQPEQKE